MISALVGHLVGDYLLQTDLMASKKKESCIICMAHCFIWTCCVVFFAQWPNWTVVPLFVTHFVQDKTQIIKWYMDTIGQKDFRTGPCAPWSSIVVDNVFHILTIWIIWKFI